MMNGSSRRHIKPGLAVLIVLKKDQCSGKLTEGVVQDVLTKSPTHPHGIKVRLQNGEIGIVTRRGENAMKPIVHAVVGPRGAPLPASIKRDSSNAEYTITEMVVRDRAVKLDVHRMWGY